MPSLRPSPADRTFSCSSVERLLTEVSSRIADPELAWLFANCFPNTLDTTVAFQPGDPPDTFVITGDIPAMWLRDSAAQVWPFLPLAAEDHALRAMLGGVVRRQAVSVLLDPYANAFYREPVWGYWRDDRTQMRPGVHERKWELDSLAYFFRLSHGYWEATRDAGPFDSTWMAAVGAALDVLAIEQGDGARSTYAFERPGGAKLPREGRGGASAPCGLVRCGFRPSDDMVAFPFLVPANAMLTVSLRALMPLLETLGHPGMADRADRLSAEVATALRDLALVRHPVFGEIWAYEIDGLGGVLCMDDANVPSLLAMPYLGFCERDDPTYLRTRAFCLSPQNPSYVAGERFQGIGSPHTKPGTIWPMALTMQALTAQEDGEILDCLRQLRACHAGTGFLHEGFLASDPSDFSRPWFSWANTLFGELIVTLARERPWILREIFP